MRFVITLISKSLLILLLLSFSQQSSKADVIDKIIVQIGDRVITLHELQTYAPRVVQKIYSIDDTEERKKAWIEYYESTVSDLIASYQLQIAAARYGIVANDVEIDSMILTISEQNPYFREEVRIVLDRENVVTPEIRMIVSKHIIQQRLVPVLLERVVVSERDLREYLREKYKLELNKTQYKIKMGILYHDEIYNKFADAYKSLNSFDKAMEAVELSAIDLGWVTQEQILPEVYDAIENLKPKTLSAMIKDSEGRCLVAYLEDVRSKVVISDQARAVAMQELGAERWQSTYDQWLERHKRSILVTRYDADM